MKYAMESRWSGKIAFITDSPQETFGWFAGFLLKLVGTNLYEGNREKGWRLVEKSPDSVVWKKFKPTKKILSQSIEMKLMCQGCDMFAKPITMEEVTQ